MGCSVDWDRAFFTMDKVILKQPHLSRPALEQFIIAYPLSTQSTLFLLNKARVPFINSILTIVSCFNLMVIMYHVIFVSCFFFQ